MTLGTRAQLFQSRTFRTVRRPGLYEDIDDVGVVNLFNVSGVCAVHYMFGVVTTTIGAGLALPQLHFTPTIGAGQIPLSGASLSIAGDVAGTIYTWTGILNGLLTVGAVLGISDVNATSDWAAGVITLPAGVINLITSADALSGVIDWYVMYLPQVAGSLITAA